MALFKIYSGTADEFPTDYALHPGYAYFFEDSGELVIDTENGRIDVKATVLTRDSGDELEFIDVDDVLIADGGLTTNAILIGGTDNTVKAVAVADGSLVVGDGTNGVAGLAGTGALYATVSGAPSFGTLPLTAGGTGATTAAAARSNLDVYSKTESEDLVAESTSVAYTTTLSASSWTGNDDDGYVYSYSNTSLTCGKNNNVPPIISWTSNQDDYSKITSAEATVGTGIIFYSDEAIESDIGIVIIDVK